MSEAKAPDMTAPIGAYSGKVAWDYQSDTAEAQRLRAMVNHCAEAEGLLIGSMALRVDEDGITTVICIPGQDEVQAWQTFAGMALDAQRIMASAFISVMFAHHQEMTERIWPMAVELAKVAIEAEANKQREREASE